MILWRNDSLELAKPEMMSALKRMRRLNCWIAPNGLLDNIAHAILPKVEQFMKSIMQMFIA